MSMSLGESAGTTVIEPAFIPRAWAAAKSAGVSAAVRMTSSVDRVHIVVRACGFERAEDPLDLGSQAVVKAARDQESGSVAACPGHFQAAAPGKDPAISVTVLASGPCGPPPEHPGVWPVCVVQRFCDSAIAAP